MQAIVGTPTEDDLCEARRAAIRKSLDEIVIDVGMAMRDAGLDFPVNIIVPHSGDALVMVGSPLDPSRCRLPACNNNHLRDRGR